MASTEFLHCPEFSIAAQKVDGTSWLWRVIHSNKMWEELLEHQGCNTQRQCHPAGLNLLLVKEAAPAPPLALPEQRQDVPSWLTVGIRLRDGGSDRKVNVSSCSHEQKVSVWDTRLSLQHRCKGVLTPKDVLHSLFTPPSWGLSPASCAQCCSPDSKAVPCCLGCAVQAHTHFSTSTSWCRAAQGNSCHSPKDFLQSPFGKCQLHF